MALTFDEPVSKILNSVTTQMKAVISYCAVHAIDSKVLTFALVESLPWPAFKPKLLGSSFLAVLLFML